MSKTMVLPLAVPQQLSASHQQATPQASQGFEAAGSIMKRMMTNLALYGDMLAGEVQPRRTKNQRDGKNGN